MHLLALKATGFSNHARSREAVRLLTDRLLSGGGCNYGNTTVLDQELMPHVAPTGIVLLALVGEEDCTGRIHKSVNYLERELSAQSGAVSFCYGLMALDASHCRAGRLQFCQSPPRALSKGLADGACAD
jgi:hypothetical protein